MVYNGAYDVYDVLVYGVIWCTLSIVYYGPYGHGVYGVQCVYGVWCIWCIMVYYDGYCYLFIR